MAKNHVKPDHYKGKKFSPWEVIEEYFDTKWHVGTAFKYMSRMGKKIYPGCTAKESELHDTRKAIEELQRHEALLTVDVETEKEKKEDFLKGSSFYHIPEDCHYFVDNSGNVYKYTGGVEWKRVSYMDTTFEYNHVPW